MTSREEIKNLFVQELKNTSVYSEVLLLKHAIIAEIAAPHVNMYFSYTYTQYLNDDELKIFAMCCLLEFGFKPTDLNNHMINIDMANFI
jgi:hypothetical protein